jgi:Protein of unknown function (DUF2950)
VAQHLCCRQPVHPRHPDIHQHKVWPVFRIGALSLGAVAAFPNGGGITQKCTPQKPSYTWVVVHNQYRHITLEIKFSLLAPIPTSGARQPVPTLSSTATVSRTALQQTHGRRVQVRARDIGRNELLAIDACFALANAQEIYLSSGTAREYAQRAISTPGKQDGLYWPAPQSQSSSPLGHLSQFPKYSLPSAPKDEPLVIDGYTLRVLTVQGDAAPGGAKSYIANGKMTDGFAILATPVKYGETGIMTFMIGREGLVYEQDLGPDTVKLAASIQEYNPDEYWWPVE